ncbi:sugar ABC transporter ATP-binding protein, partial [Rhizobium ruizarguesonis]
VVEAQPGRAVIALESDSNTRLTLPVADPIEAGAKVTLGIRPEHFVDAGTGDADVTVTIDVAEHLGDMAHAPLGVGFRVAV